MVDELLEHGFRVTLRPHPQTAKFALERLNAIVARHADNSLFEYEPGIAGQESLHRSDILISDWSGAALDYAFGLGKPVLFIDVPRKVNNPNYLDLKLVPFEQSIREKIGRVISPGDLDALATAVNACAAKQGTFEQTRRDNVFNMGTSAKVGAEVLMKLVADAPRTPG